MSSFANELVVITGAASGIGKALALNFFNQGCRLALLDIDAGGLKIFCDELNNPPSVLGIKADVSDEEDVSNAAELIEREIGTPSVLCNSAGVGVAGSAIDTPNAIWDWTFGVNVHGVVNSVRSFLPSMIERNRGYVMNVASIAGLLAPVGMAAYSASKHAVIGYTESLLHELNARNSDVAVSVACPGMVDTNISHSERHWPDRLGERPAMFDSRTAKAIQLKHKRALSKAMSADDAAAKIIDGMQSKQFWIFTDDLYLDEIAAHADVTQSPQAPKYV